MICEYNLPEVDVLDAATAEKLEGTDPFHFSPLFLLPLLSRRDRHCTSGFRGGSVVEWLACWTQAQKGPGSNRSRDAVE